MADSFAQQVIETLKRAGNRTGNALMTAPWLTSPFEAPRWRLKFADEEMELDWRKQFGTGLLTSESHADTLNIFKCWLTIQSHPIVKGQTVQSDESAKKLVRQTLAQIDYLLLNPDILPIAEFGFGAMTDFDFRQIMYAQESAASDISALYEWERHFANYAESLCVVHGRGIEETIDTNEFLSEVDIPEEDWSLKVNKDTLVRWRAACWIDGDYQSIGNADFRLTINTVKVAGKVFRNTIAGTGSKPLFPEMGLRPIERCRREKPAVPVRASGEKPTNVQLGLRRAKLRALCALGRFGLKVPSGRLQSALDQGIVSKDSTRILGRYHTVPLPVMFSALRNSTEFMYEHGEHVVDSYVAVLRAAHAEGVDPHTFSVRFDIRSVICEKTLALGVEQFSGGVVARRGRAKLRQVFDDVVTEQYFRGVRENRYLVELGRVLLGAGIEHVGAMSQRRQQELLGLSYRDALDEVGRYIVFWRGKSGVLDIKQKEIRPIPKSCADFVELSSRLHEGIDGIGGYQAHAGLFDVPGVYGLRPASHVAFNFALDTFFDYFSGTTDELGRRWYVRQHQNRKFLIVVFYFLTDYSDEETVKFMLAHSDKSALYNYLTKEVPNAMMREVHAYVLREKLKHFPHSDSDIEVSDDVAIRLADSVESWFGTRDFSLVDGDALEEYLLYAQARGLKVAPHFFDIDGVQTFRIAITVEKGASL
ncbi:hypothetical protein ACQKRQ_09255 [Paraburkholderia sp. NPDC080076]|uniref:hypothetical protein n=1 Tax=Paraburkholderia sp. NPDC080076 TaxID=3390605 RepID=UPI003D07BC93